MEIICLSMSKAKNRVPNSDFLLLKLQSRGFPYCVSSLALIFLLLHDSCFRFVLNINANTFTVTSCRKKRELFVRIFLLCSRSSFEVIRLKVAKHFLRVEYPFLLIISLNKFKNFKNLESNCYS